MTNIKKPAVSGMFYPGSKEKLIAFMEKCKNMPAVRFAKTDSRLVIAPHAGYVYSGESAYLALSAIANNVKNIFIIAPAHKMYFEGAAICTYDSFETPLGIIPQNKVISEELSQNFGCLKLDEAYEGEHAIEVHLPFLINLLKDFKIIPVLAGRCAAQCIKKIIENYYNNPQNAFIISSDLSHFLDDRTARKCDALTAEMIESTNVSGFNTHQACNAAGIVAATDFARAKNFSFIRLDMHNSSDITHDKKRVVGYGSWIMYEGSTNKYLKEQYGGFLKSICRNSIINKGNYMPDEYPAVLDSMGASFVTLEKFGALRGCIGSIAAHRALIDDLILNAASAAYHDPRFLPVRNDEIDDIQIKISLLSEPHEILFDSQDDLLSKITPFKDGIIIKEKNHQAVYLPSVWEQLPDKKLFLNSLKQKAGLNADYFSDTIKAYCFHSEYI